jgi:hypothetical protein
MAAAIAGSARSVAIGDAEQFDGALANAGAAGKEKHQRGV